jgi:hypothetical protein
MNPKGHAHRVITSPAPGKRVFWSRHSAAKTETTENTDKYGYIWQQQGTKGAKLLARIPRIAMNLPTARS